MKVNTPNQQMAFVDAAGRLTFYGLKLLNGLTTTVGNPPSSGTLAQQIAALGVQLDELNAAFAALQVAQTGDMVMQPTPHQQIFPDTMQTYRIEGISMEPIWQE